VTVDTLTAVRSRNLITDAAAIARCARALAEGAIVAQAFANFYAITTRADEPTVRGVNLMKGRPADQVGSITGPPAALPDAWELDRLPDRLPRRTAITLLDTFFALGPFGFRGPAAAAVPAHLTFPDGEITTAQVIAPGYACPSNAFLAAARRATGDDLLYITSANRSRHRTRADDSPAHWRAAGLAEEFGDERGFLILEHDDEVVTRARYPQHLPMSTTILGLQTVREVAGDPRPHLVLERHGSLPADTVRSVLAEFGYGLIIGPKAGTRLLLRDYSERLSDP
jgi:tRNA A37 threonylcarbamoyladenosine synthetase subunit TsaC/SUA5/YrdC